MAEEDAVMEVANERGALMRLVSGSPSSKTKDLKQQKKDLADQMKAKAKELRKEQKCAQKRKKSASKLDEEDLSDSLML